MPATPVKTATIAMNVVIEGQGPAVILCHGFPETAHAWRHQVTALADAGFRAIAPDMRGYGGTAAPDGIEDYTIFHLVGDMVALLDALEEPSALIVGNDWGATVAWQAAQMRPDRFTAVVALGVPFMARAPTKPTELFPRNGDNLFYTLYFQEEGRAEAEFERDPRRALLKLLWGASAKEPSSPNSATNANPFAMVSQHDGMLDPLPDYADPPAWIAAANFATLVEAFARSGFRGGLNYYRNLDRNWEMQAALDGLNVTVPALFVAGADDAGLQMPGMPDILAVMPDMVPHLRAPVFVPGAGHWVAQERPTDLNTLLVGFARSVSV